MEPRTLKNVYFKRDEYDENERDWTTLKTTFQSRITLVKCAFYYKDTGDSITGKIYKTYLRFIGKEYFRKTECQFSFTYKKGKWYGNSLRSLYASYSEIFKDILTFYKLDWLLVLLPNRDLEYIISLKTMFIPIIKGKITNPEQLYKFYLKRCYKLDLPWKIFRLALDNGFRDDLYDICAFTTNPSLWIKDEVRYKNSSIIWQSPEYELHNLKKATFELAIRLGVQINPAWSSKRFNEEHDKFVRTIMEKEISSKEKVEIYNSLPFISVGKILNTEHEIFIQAQIFHNCSYTNYYDYVKNHKYILIVFEEAEVGEKCMLGIRLGTKTWLWDQLFKPYNVRVSEQTQLKVKNIFDSILPDLNTKKFIEFEENNLAEDYNTPEFP